MQAKRAVWFLTATVLLLAAGLGAVLLYDSQQAVPDRGLQPIAVVAPMEPDPQKWALNYPRQYDTWLRTERMARTAYGGSVPYSKPDADPRLRTLYAGSGYANNYNEDRGHYWALEDVTTSGRDPKAGTCLSCKSSDTPRLLAELSPATFYAMPFDELLKQTTHSVSCANCHEAGSMNLVLTNPALRTALTAQGRDPDRLSRQELRTLVCANCHVEYYMAGPGNELVLPWANGTTVEEIEAYYDTLQVAGEPFKDWTHALTGAPLIKIQHPDYELYTAGSTHYAGGVACADCHMPYVRDGAQKFSSHFVASPLTYAAQACGPCHSDVTAVVDRVAVIQGQVAGTLSLTEDALVSAITVISDTAALPQVDFATLQDARQLQRKAQLRWDFVASENSMGFHNPQEALSILATAIDDARQAEILAHQAAVNR